MLLEGAQLAFRSESGRRRQSAGTIGALAMSEDESDRRLAARMYGCGSVLQWVVRNCPVPCSKSGRRALVHGITCRSRFCAWCAHRRSLKFAQRLEKRIEGTRRPGSRYAFLTLTGLSSPSPAGLQGKLVSDFAKLRRRKIWKGVSASAWGFEVTLTENGWHPHLHVLIEIRPGAWLADQAAWSDAWREINGAYIVDIRPVRPSPKGIGGAVRELVKYITKLAEVRDPAQILELHHATRGLTLYRTTGAWRGVVEPESEADLLDREDEFDLGVCPECRCHPMVDLQTWTWNGYRFVMRETELLEENPERRKTWRRPPDTRYLNLHQLTKTFRDKLGQAQENVKEMSTWE